MLYITITNIMATLDYHKEFSDYDSAYDWMVMKNKVSVKDLFCVVPGAEELYAVVDLGTAVDLGLGYVWSTSHLNFVEDPFYKN